MNMAIVSLLLLVAVITVGFWKKVNVGIVSIFTAFLLGTFLDIKDADIIKGFGTQLFITLLGITLLCSIVQYMDGAVNPNILITMIAICAAYAGLSPASTGGGLILAASATDPNFSEAEKAKMFVRLFLLSAVTILIIGTMVLLGVFNLFV